MNILTAPKDWRVFIVNYSEGDPVAVCAPSFGAALDAMVAYCNRDADEEGFEPITRADLDHWLDQVTMLSEDVVIAEGWCVAAPDLLEALRALADSDGLIYHHDDDDEGDVKCCFQCHKFALEAAEIAHEDHCIVGKARAAIARAEGRS